MHCDSVPSRLQFVDYQRRLIYQLNFNTFDFQDQAQAVDILKTLKKQPMTLEVLQVRVEFGSDCENSAIQALLYIFPNFPSDLSHIVENAHWYDGE